MSGIRHRREFLAAGLGAMAPAARGDVQGRAVGGKRAVIAAESEPSARAASEALRAGGNAFDAVAAAAIACCMTEPHMVDLGGYVSAAVVLDARDGTVWAVDADSAAPSASTPDMFRVREPKAAPRGINENEYGCSVQDNANVEGALAIAVPSTLAGIGVMHEKWGRLKWAGIVAPSERILAEGFRVTASLAGAVAMKSAVIGRFPASAAHLMPDGRPPRAGDVWRRPDIQRTLRRIASAGWQDFYRGELARAIVGHVRSLGGVLTARDLEQYRPIVGPALESACGASRFYTAPLPNGGLTALSAVLMLHRLRAPSPESEGYWRLLAEVLKIVWRDRLREFGDPAAGGPDWRRYVSAEYIWSSTEKLRRDPSSVDAATKEPGSSPGTVHISAADREGNLVAMTISHGGFFGSGVTVPGTGITLGHGMCRFDPHPGLPNSVAPGKRPLNNVSPMLVRQPDRDAALGMRGGRRIVSVVTSLAYQLLLGRSGDAALREQRLHAEGYEPLEAQGTMPARTRESLAAVGHRLNFVEAVGGGASVAERARGGALRAASTVSALGVD